MNRAQIESRIAELKVENEKAPGGAGTNARAELIRELEAQLPCSAESCDVLAELREEYDTAKDCDIFNLEPELLKRAADEIERLRGQVRLSDSLLDGLTAVVEGLKAEMADHTFSPAQPALKPFGYLRIWDHTDISTDFFFERPDDLVGAKIVAVYAPQDSATANLAGATTAPVLIATHASEGLPSSDAAGAGAVQHLSAGNADAIGAAQFLLDRLDEFDPGDDEPEREYHGHVAPAIARLRSALTEAVPQGGQD